MKLSDIAAIGVTGLLFMSGCSDNVQSGDPLPAPSRSTEAAGNTVPSPQRQEELRALRQGEENAEAPTEQTEFAALDTDSSGALEEQEWESEEVRSLPNLKNRTFAQLDQDASGGIDPDEFSKARTTASEEEGAETGAESAVREPEPEVTEPSGA